MMNELKTLRVPFGAIWVWQFRQQSFFNVHGTTATLKSLEPGYDNDILDKIREFNGVAAPSGDDINPPRVVLTYPIGNEDIKRNRTIDMHADASDNFGVVSKVEFYVDGKLVKVVRQVPYQASTVMSEIGSHRITAKAYDRAGNSSQFSTDINVVGR
jgi:hypothetical protein